MYRFLTSILLIFAISTSCTTTSTDKQGAEDLKILKSEVLYCIEFQTPMGLKYYLCEDVFHYCYLTEAGGLQCMPKPQLYEDTIQQF